MYTYFHTMNIMIIINNNNIIIIIIIIMSSCPLTARFWTGAKGKAMVKCNLFSYFYVDRTMPLCSFKLKMRNRNMFIYGKNVKKIKYCDK